MLAIGAMTRDCGHANGAHEVAPLSNDDRICLSNQNKKKSGKKNKTENQKPKLKLKPNVSMFE